MDNGRWNWYGEDEQMKIDKIQLGNFVQKCNLEIQIMAEKGIKVDGGTLEGFDSGYKWGMLTAQQVILKELMDVINGDIKADAVPEITDQQAFDIVAEYNPELASDFMDLYREWKK